MNDRTVDLVIDASEGVYGPEAQSLAEECKRLVKPTDMVLHCPNCGAQHIDAVTETWPNPPHRTHLCHSCGHKWRPADVATNGVAAVKTRGKDDSPIATPAVRPNAPPPQWMPIQGTPLAVRMSVLDDLTAYKNHRQNLVELADRGGMSPAEAVALAKKLPLPYVWPTDESRPKRNRMAVIVLSELGTSTDGQKP
jgi:predicted RNA-binding Zn-ribbon protein involved in translation (DUF1610 family)